jgi:hypothetical protein
MQGHIQSCTHSKHGTPGENNIGGDSKARQRELSALERPKGREIMSIIYCDICDKSVDTDYAAEHFDSHTEAIKVQINGQFNER